MSAKTGILTGAAGGIGRATAERLVSDGWSLVLVDQTDAVAEVARQMKVGDGQKVSASPPTSPGPTSTARSTPPSHRSARR